MCAFIKQNDEVLYAVENRLSITVETFENLRSVASQNSRKRARICMHDDRDAGVHEMLIIHGMDCFVRPHAHMDRDESMLVHEGEADLVFFSHDGLIIDVVAMGPIGSGKVHYHRHKKNQIHMLLIRSEWLVFSEVTSGPFVSANTIFPEWAPAEQDEKTAEFLLSVERALDAWNMAREMD